MKKIILLLFLLPVSLFSQHIFNTTGKFLESNKNTITYSIGDLIIGEITGKNTELLQGFISSELKPQKETDASEIQNNDFLLHPNPVSDFLYLTNNIQHINGKIYYQLYKLTGESLLRGETDTKETIIDFRQYPANIYILKIFSDNIQNKVYYIMKVS